MNEAASGDLSGRLSIGLSVPPPLTLVGGKQRSISIAASMVDVEG